MRSEHRVGAALALAIAGTGCGDGLVGEDYLGTPWLTLGGQVTVQPAVPEPDNPRLSLFWLGYDTTGLARSALEQRVEVENRFPAGFTMSVFDAPPAAALPFALQDGGGLGVAFLAVYADANDNGMMNSDPLVAPAGPDALIGASARHLVLYAEAAVDPSSDAGTRAGGGLEPGYHLMESVEASATCSYSDTLDCRGDPHLVEVAADTPLELTIVGDPRAVVLPKPGGFVEGLGN